MNMNELRRRAGIPLKENDISQLIAKAFPIFKQEIDWGGGSGETFVEEYRRDTGDDSEKEININGRAFNAWLKGWFQQAAGDVYENLTWMFRSGVVIYREITAVPEWRPTPAQPLGIYWSYEKDAAEAHWAGSGENQVAFLLEGKTAIDSIDWIMTLVQNAQPDYQQEKEVRLRKRAPIELVGVYALGGKFKRHGLNWQPVPFTPGQYRA